MVREENTENKNEFSSDEEEDENNQINLSLPHDEPTEQINYLFEKIEEFSSSNNFEATKECLKLLEQVVKKNQKHYDNLFFSLIEGYLIALQSQEENSDEEILNFITTKLTVFLQENLSNEDHTAAIADAILQALNILGNIDNLEILEGYVNFLINLALENAENIILRTSTADAIIIALTAFGGDWNYEKTVEFGDLLRGLLPIEESKGLFASILIKGIAEEISCYGDMQEFSALTRSLNDMRTIFSLNTDSHDEIIKDYSEGLVNAVKWFGEAEDYEKMISILDELAKLMKDFDEIDLKIIYANGLRIALDLSGVMEDLDAITRFTRDLVSLGDELSYNKDIQILVINGVFKAAAWAGVFWETGFMVSYITRIGKIVRRFPEDEQIKIQLARGLFNLTREISHIGKIKVMSNIVKELSTLCNDNPTIVILFEYYSKAIVNAIFLLSEITDSFEEAFGLLSESENLVSIFPENQEIILSYSKALVNTIRMLGKYGKIEEMEEQLEILRDYTIKTDDREVVIRLGKAYVDAILAYGEMEEFDKILSLYHELTEWAEDDPEDLAFQELLAKSLVNVVSGYGKKQLYLEMSIYLEKLKQLSYGYSNYSSIQTQLVKGLNLAIRWYLQINKIDEAYALQKEIEAIRQEFPDDLDIQEFYARSIRRILIFANQIQDSQLIEQTLSKLRDLFNRYTYVESIQIEIARAISNLIIEGATKEQNLEWQSLVMELKGLHIQFPRNDKLTAIFNMVSPLFTD
ncbi:MAG TPA: hypothetical protein VMX55_12955 [candidate division Zixibacteria bacterium]|nr:hypothetical protein [candidate division Zixibacteria bacterium]